MHISTIIEKTHFLHKFEIYMHFYLNLFLKIGISILLKVDSQYTEPQCHHRLATLHQNILPCIYIKMFEYTNYVTQCQYHGMAAFIKNYILTCRCSFIQIV